jgi:elongation factor 3
MFIILSPVLEACFYGLFQVLDEPTNYLDRESLGALAEAIKNFGGGVIMISHNQEFYGALCSEEWHLEAGTLTVAGQVKKKHDEDGDER